MQAGERWSAAWGSKRGTLCVLILMTSLSFGQSSKLSKDLQGLPSGQSVDVIVQYFSAPTTADANAALLAGASKGKKLGTIKANRYTMLAGTAAKLAGADANVKYISPDRPLRGAMNYAVPAINADVAHNWGFDGTGVGVAVIDSGVNSVADLQSSLKSSRVVYSQNFDTSANTTADLYGHGTHIAGIIAGNGNSSSC
jgi:serine protease AprX